jgi:2,4-diaminopentanoate dehydrogenase
LAYKVIQWGTGKNGQALIRAAARHPDLDLVGAYTWSAEKNGVDAGTLAGIGPLGVPVTNDRQALMAKDADVVLFVSHLRPDPGPTDKDITDLLRSGKNVISVTGAHSMPTAIPGYGEQFENACRAGKSTFAAAGLNPNFMAERLATTVTGLCADVESVLAQEAYLCADDNFNIVFLTVGFGRELEEWGGKDSAMSKMMSQLFSQTVYNMAHTFDVELAEVTRTVELGAVDRDLHLPAGVVKKGTVAAITQTWEGIPTDPDQIRIIKRARWAVALDVPGHPVKSGWHIEVKGKPNLVLDMRVDPPEDRTYHHETMVGSAIAVIPEVINAEPGILLPRIFAPFKRRFRGA